MLLKYVSKSALKEQIDQFDRDKHALELQALKNALEDGDANHDIFQHENCEIYLTYLSTQGEIDVNVFLQGYLYLHAKEQCQDLNLTILTDNNNALYKKTLVQYAESLVKNYPNLKTLDIIEAYFSFQGMDSWLMMIPCHTSQEIDEKHALLFSLISPPVYPYFKETTESHTVTTPIRLLQIDEHNRQLVIPSLRFIEWLTIHCNPSHQVQIAPIFGRLSEATLCEDFHRKYQHPCNLNSKLVKNNLTSAHGTNAGKFSIAAHDIYYHYVAMALIPPNILHFLMHVMMLKIRDLSNEFSYDETAIALASAFNDLEFSSDTLSILLSPGTTENCGRTLGDYFIKKLAFESHPFLINHLVIIKLCQHLINARQETPGINKNRFVIQFLSSTIFKNSIDENFLNETEIPIKDLLISLVNMRGFINPFLKGINALHESNLLNTETFTMLLDKPETGEVLSHPNFQSHLSSLSIFYHSDSANKKDAKTVPSPSA